MRNVLYEKSFALLHFSIYKYVSLVARSQVFLGPSKIENGACSSNQLRSSMEWDDKQGDTDI